MIGMRAIVGAWMLFVACGMAEAKSWETDFEAASARAKAENRFLLLDFTGSDWCGWCIRLDKEVFSQKAFERYADEELVCVMLDFPRGKSIAPKLKQQNEKLMQQYGIRGFPTILILNPDGELVGRTGYQEGGPEKYVESLQRMIAPQREKYPLKAAEKAGKPSTLRERAAGPVERELRIWTSNSGTTVEARLHQRVGDIIYLKKPDGSTLAIERSSLSQADRDYLASAR